MLVTTTAIHGKELEFIKASLQKHGLTHTLELSTETCVLVSRSSDGVKYRLARERGIPCVTMAWVLIGNCCLNRLAEFDVGNSLLGLEVCGTSLTFEQRHHLQEVCDLSQATYNGSLTRNCALLVISGESNVLKNNEKVQFARRNHIDIISYFHFMKQYGNIKMQHESKCVEYQKSLAISKDVVIYFSPANLITEEVKNLLAKTPFRYSPVLNFLTTHVVLLGNTTETFPLRPDIEFVSFTWLKHSVEQQKIVAEEPYRVVVKQRPVITFTGVSQEERITLHSALENSGLPCLVQDEFVLGVRVVEGESNERCNTTHLVVERSAMSKSSKVAALTWRMNKLRRKECLLVDLNWVRRSLEVGYWINCSPFLIEIPQISLPKKILKCPNSTAVSVIEAKTIDSNIDNHEHDHPYNENEKKNEVMKGEHEIVSELSLSPKETQSEMTPSKSLDILIEKLESKMGVLGGGPSIKTGESIAETFSNVKHVQNDNVKSLSCESKRQSGFLKSNHVENTRLKIPLQSQVIVYKYSNEYPIEVMQHEKPEEILKKKATDDGTNNRCVTVEDVVPNINKEQKNSSAPSCCIMMAKSLMHTEENLTRLQSLGCILATTMEECTHYVTGKPSRTEFFLCALAAGKWVLAPSFIDETLREGRIASEELHEWSPQMAKLSSFRNSVVELVKGCKIQRMRSVRPFSSWSIILCCATDARTESFSRVLRIGGCNVVRPYSPSQLLDKLVEDPDVLQDTTAVLSDDSVWSGTQLETIAALVPVLKMEYLAHCLCVNTPEPDLYEMLDKPQSRKRSRDFVK
ncbi:topoisomerase (DNA) II binding protein 1 [Trypanosoma theileri]|uniref:Topoisomerase (DNA) II binding protein 1 n=1 Tax=Trypanosoma theileri TaxID=67003 RepID=A0A1X0P1F4_9TRYP|nr:topoisomerase (DNA) II binding protein 1 [Trypanosoma theileri]ORC90240.1 topoisomerase (DNA) II binding protein 1 [Trypanosoma theileri]